MRFQPGISQYCKSSVNKSEILTFGLQKRGHFAVLVKGLSPGSRDPMALQPQAAAGNGQVGFVKIVAALHLLVVLLALTG